MSDSDTLAVPHWLPAAVSGVAKELFRDTTVSDRAVIIRLTTHQKMRQVWLTLQKSSNALGWPDTVEERRRRAAKLFRAACNTRVSAFTDKAIEAFRTDILKYADQLGDAIEYIWLTRRELWPYTLNLKEEHATAVRSIITECQRGAEEVKTLPRALRAGGPDRNGQGYILQLVDNMQKLFGQPMAGTVASIATVALNKHITIKRVQRLANPRLKGKAPSRKLIASRTVTRRQDDTIP